MNAIDVVNVTKTYRKYARRRQFATLKSAILSGTLVSDLNPDETFHALKGVSFAVRQGCTFGIVGRNGSGKSTALKLVAGITKPTTGSVSVQGRISALIELGAGFHPEISGRENVFINGIMLGLSKREITRRFVEKERCIMPFEQGLAGAISLRCSSLTAGGTRSWGAWSHATLSKRSRRNTWNVPIIDRPSHDDTSSLV